LAKRKPLGFAMPRPPNERGTPCKDATPLLHFINELKPNEVKVKSVSEKSDQTEQLCPVISEAISRGNSDAAIPLDESNLSPISTYLQELTDEKVSEYLVPDKVLLKYAIGMDIIRPSDSRSCCFTRAYGHYAVGTGSVLQHCLGQGDMDKAFELYSCAVDKQKRGEERYVCFKDL